MLPDLLLDLTRVFLFDVCCVVALLLTFRFFFPSPIALMSLRIGLILVLAEDVIGFAAQFGASVLSAHHSPTFDLARSWASVAGTTGALLVCAALLRLLPAVWAGKGLVLRLSPRERSLAMDTWII